MIENFELKEDLDFESEIGIKNNDVIRNEVQDVLAWKYKSGDKVGNTWEIIDAHLTLNPYQPYLNIFNRPFKKDYLEKEHKWYMSQDLSIKDGWTTSRSGTSVHQKTISNLSTQIMVGVFSQRKMATNMKTA